VGADIAIEALFGEPERCGGLLLGEGQARH
jgi:hypothetical protein